MSSPAELLSRPLELPCGVSVRNRILKSAMSEVLASPAHAPTSELERLYGRWAQGGLGVAVTGNVMIDGRALGEPGNVVVEDERDLAALTRWADAATREGTACWMQLNHPGKQAPKFLNRETVAPSAIGFGPELASAFATPRELTDDEILELVQRFATSAGIARKAGFGGVQIHGAHGYLVSQFLSPHHNQRTDRWGGSLDNRARFVLAVYGAIREAVGPDFPVAIKMNSADFQKGGFTEEESRDVMVELARAGIDLIEVSGGTYETPAMVGQTRSQRTLEREGYFLAFVEQARDAVEVPLCVTGGFRTPAGMATALEEGADMVGLARTLCIHPDFAARCLAGEDVRSAVHRLSTGMRAVDRVAALDVTWYENQLHLMGTGRDPRPQLGAWSSLFTSVRRAGVQAFRMRRPKSRRDTLGNETRGG